MSITNSTADRCTTAAKTALHVGDGNDDEPSPQPLLVGWVAGDRGAADTHQSCRVLVVESDNDERNSLSKRLVRQGYPVQVAPNGEQALGSWPKVDLILLDPNLSDVDGLEFCRFIRATSATPIIIVADRGSELDCVLGLRSGADDYVAKPYGFQELVARMDALMRRARPLDRTRDDVIEIGGLRIDPRSRDVVIGGRRITTTRKEFELLRMLAEESGNVVPRDAILSHVWGGSWSYRTVDTHVSSLRGKLGDSSWIVAVRGVGFKLVQQ